MEDIEEFPYNNKNILIGKDDINAILHRYGIERDCILEDVYRRAMVHKSYITRKNDNFISGNQNCPNDCLPLQEESNERYEFLGDSVLSTTVAHYLYRRYPDQNEGFMTKMRSKLVNGYMLADLSRAIGLNKWLIISQQIEENKGRNNYNILEDAFEAFICAIYLDFNDSEIKHSGESMISGLGFQIAEKWIINVLEEYVDFANLIQQNKNYKDQLIKLYQHTYMKRLEFYEIDIKTVGYNKKMYKVGIKCEGKILGIGTGESRKKAEQNASENVLNRIM